MRRVGSGRTQASSFTSPIGTPLDPRNVTREFHALLSGAELPAVRFHDLRHTAATLLLAQGVDPRTIMETLGHSQISLTLNTYSHVRCPGPTVWRNQLRATARQSGVVGGGVVGRTFGWAAVRFADGACAMRSGPRRKPSSPADAT